MAIKMSIEKVIILSTVLLIMMIGSLIGSSLENHRRETPIRIEDGPTKFIFKYDCNVYKQYIDGMGTVTIVEEVVGD